MRKTEPRQTAPSAGARRVPAAEASPEVAMIVRVDEQRRAHVHIAGRVEPVIARSTLGAASRSRTSFDDLVGQRVLVCFEEGDRDRPIVLGLVREEVRPEPELPEYRLEAGSGKDVFVDGRRLVIEAQHEILIRCGKSTISLGRDGKILIRGAHVVSRSSGPNKIKGGSISLN